MNYNSNTEILVLDENGTNLGRMPYQDAKSLAMSRKLDLVLINKNRDVQVFKIMDYGKYKYEQKKQKQKKTSHLVKEMNFKLRIAPHDQEIKIKRIKSFLEKGADVKIAVIMRGREKANPDIAYKKMDEILKVFGDSIQVQQRGSSSSAISAMIRPIDKHSEKSEDGCNNIGNKNGNQENQKVTI